MKMCMAVVTGRTTLPILSCLLVEAKDGEVRFLASDLDRWMECRVPAEVTKAGATALSARILIGIFAKGDEATVEVDEKLKATIRCGGSTFKFPGLNAKEMPEPESIDGGGFVELASSEWLEASGAVKWAASSDTNRMTICGTYLTEDDNRLKLVATDGSRLSHSITENGSFPGTAIVPTDTMNAINLVAGLGDVLRLSVGEGLISAACEGARITSKLIHGDYPNWRQVIPARTSNATTVRIAVKPFLEAIDRASIMIDSKSPGVLLTVTDGRVDISVQKEDSESDSSVEAMTSGPDAKVYVSGPKLAEPLRNWDADDVEMEIQGEMLPVLIYAPQRSEYVLMPMRFMS